MTSNLWFILIICLLVLSLLILLILFLVRYNRGAKYRVFEKERRHGAKGGRLDEEDRFCEYVRRSVAYCCTPTGSTCILSQTENPLGTVRQWDWVIRLFVVWFESPSLLLAV